MAKGDRINGFGRQPQRQPTLWAWPAAQILKAVCGDAGPLEQSDSVAIHQAERVSLVEFYGMLESSVDRSGDPTRSLKLSDEFTEASLGALGFLIVSSPDVATAFERMLRYQRVYSDGEKCELEIHGDTAVFRFTPFGPTRPAHRHVVNMFVCDIVVNSQAMLGGSLGVKAIRFRHSAEGQEAIYAQILGVPPAFGASENEVEFSASALQRPLPRSNPGLFRFLDEYVQRMLEQLPSDAGFAEQVRRQISAHLQEGDACLELVASVLGCSSRTLQRRLRDEGTTFHDQHDAIRQARAKACLVAGMPIDEVTYLTGYTDRSTFHRAFKRWTGVTPETWKQSSPAG